MIGEGGKREGGRGVGERGSEFLPRHSCYNVGSAKGGEMSGVYVRTEEGVLMCISSYPLDDP